MLERDKKYTRCAASNPNPQEPKRRSSGQKSFRRLYATVSRNLFVFNKNNFLFIFLVFAISVFVFLLIFKFSIFSKDIWHHERLENVSGIVVKSQIYCRIELDIAKKTRVDANMDFKLYIDDNHIAIFEVNPVIVSKNECKIKIESSRDFNKQIQVLCLVGCYIYRKTFDEKLLIDMVIIGKAMQIYMKNVEFTNLELYAEHSNINFISVLIKNSSMLLKNTEMLIKNDLFLKFSIVQTNSNYLFVNKLPSTRTTNDTCLLSKNTMQLLKNYQQRLIMGKLSFMLSTIFPSAINSINNCVEGDFCTINADCIDIVYQGKSSITESSLVLDDNDDSTSSQVARYEGDEASVNGIVTDMEPDDKIKLAMIDSSIVVTTVDIFDDVNYAGKKFATNFYDSYDFLNKDLDNLYNEISFEWISMLQKINFDYPELVSFLLKKKMLIMTSKICAINNNSEVINNFIFVASDASSKDRKYIFGNYHSPLKKEYLYNKCRTLSPYFYNGYNMMLNFIYYGLYMFKKIKSENKIVGLSLVFYIQDKQSLVRILKILPTYFTIDESFYDADTNLCSNFAVLTLDKMNYIKVYPYICTIHMRDNIIFNIFQVLVLILVIIFLLVLHYLAVTRISKTGLMPNAALKNHSENNKGPKTILTKIFQRYFGVNYNVYAHKIIEVSFWKSVDSFNIFSRSLFVKKSDINKKYPDNKDIHISAVLQSYYNFCNCYELTPEFSKKQHLISMFRDRKLEINKTRGTFLRINELIILELKQLNYELDNLNDYSSSLDIFVSVCCKKYKPGFSVKFEFFLTQYGKFCEMNNFIHNEPDADTLKNSYGFIITEKKTEYVMSNNFSENYMINISFIDKYMSRNLSHTIPKLIIKKNDLKITKWEMAKILLFYLMIDIIYLLITFGKSTIIPFSISTDVDSIAQTLDFLSLRSTSLYYILFYSNFAVILMFMDRFFIPKQHMYCSNVVEYMINVPIWTAIYILLFMKAYIFTGVFTFALEELHEISMFNWKEDTLLILILINLFFIVIYFVIRSKTLKKMAARCLQDSRKQLLQQLCHNKLAENDYFRLSKNDELIDPLKSKIKKNESLNLLNYYVKNRKTLGNKFKPLFYSTCVRLGIELPHNLFELMLIISSDNDKKLIDKYYDFILRFSTSHLNFRAARDYESFEANFNELKPLFTKVMECATKRISLTTLTNLTFAQNLNIKHYIKYISEYVSKKQTPKEMYRSLYKTVNMIFDDSKMLQMLLYAFTNPGAIIRHFNLSNTEINNYLKKLFPLKMIGNELSNNVESFFISYAKMQIQNKISFDILEDKDFEVFQTHLTTNLLFNQASIDKALLKILYRLRNVRKLNYNNFNASLKQMIKNDEITHDLAYFLIFIQIVKVPNLGNYRFFFKDLMVETNPYVRTMLKKLEIDIYEFKGLLSLMIGIEDDSIVTFVHYICRIYRIENNCDFFEFLYTLLTKNQRDNDQILEQFMNIESVALLNYLNSKSIKYDHKSVEIALASIRKLMQPTVKADVIELFFKSIEKKDYSIFAKTKFEIANNLSNFKQICKLERLILEIDLVFQLMLVNRNTNQLFKILKVLYAEKFKKLQSKKIIKTLITLLIRLEETKYDTGTVYKKNDSTSISQLGLLLNIHSDYLYNLANMLFYKKSKYIYEFIVKIFGDKEIQKIDDFKFSNLKSAIKIFVNEINKLENLMSMLYSHFEDDETFKFMILIVKRMLGKETNLHKDKLTFFVDKLFENLYFKYLPPNTKKVNKIMIEFLDNLSKSVIQHTSRYLAAFFATYYQQHAFFSKILSDFFSTKPPSIIDLLNSMEFTQHDVKDKFVLPTLIFYKASNHNFEIPAIYLDAPSSPFNQLFSSVLDLLLDKTINFDLVFDAVIEEKDRKKLKKHKMFEDFYIQMYLIMSENVHLMQKLSIDTRNRSYYLVHNLLVLKRAYKRRLFIKYDNTKTALRDIILDPRYDEFYNFLNIDKYELLIVLRFALGSIEFKDLISLLNTMNIDNNQTLLYMVNIIVAYKERPIYKDFTCNYLNDIKDISHLFRDLLNIETEDLTACKVAWMYNKIMKNDFYSFDKLIKSTIYKSTIKDQYFDLYLNHLYLMSLPYLNKSTDCALLTKMNNFIAHNGPVNMLNCKEAYFCKLLKKNKMYGSLVMYSQSFARPSVNFMDENTTKIFNNSITLTTMWVNVFNLVQKSLESYNNEFINFFLRFVVLIFMDRLALQKNDLEDITFRQFFKLRLSLMKDYFKNHIINKMIDFEYHDEYLYFPEYDPYIQKGNPKIKFYEYLNEEILEEYYKQLSMAEREKKKHIASVRSCYLKCCKNHSLFVDSHECTVGIYDIVKLEVLKDNLFTLLFNNIGSFNNNIRNPERYHLYPELKDFMEKCVQTQEDLSPEEDLCLGFSIVILMNIRGLHDKVNIYPKKSFDSQMILHKILIHLNIVSNMISGQELPTIPMFEILTNMIDMIILNEYKITCIFTEEEKSRYKKFKQTYELFKIKFNLNDFKNIFEYFDYIFPLYQAEAADMSAPPPYATENSQINENTENIEFQNIFTHDEVEKSIKLFTCSYNKVKKNLYKLKLFMKGNSLFNDEFYQQYLHKYNVPLKPLKKILYLNKINDIHDTIYNVDLRTYFKEYMKSDVEIMFDLVIYLTNHYNDDMFRTYIGKPHMITFNRICLNSESIYAEWLDLYGEELYFSSKTIHNTILLLKASEKKLTCHKDTFVEFLGLGVKKKTKKSKFNEFAQTLHKTMTNAQPNDFDPTTVTPIFDFCNPNSAKRFEKDFLSFLNLVDMLLQKKYDDLEKLDMNILKIFCEYLGINNSQMLSIIGILNSIHDQKKSETDLDLHLYKFISHSDYDLFNVDMNSISSFLIFLKYFKSGDPLKILLQLKRNFDKKIYCLTISMLTVLNYDVGFNSNPDLEIKDMIGLSFDYIYIYALKHYNYSTVTVLSQAFDDSLNSVAEKLYKIHPSMDCVKVVEIYMNLNSDDKPEEKLRKPLTEIVSTLNFDGLSCDIAFGYYFFTNSINFINTKQISEEQLIKLKGLYTLLNSDIEDLSEEDINLVFGYQNKISDHLPNLKFYLNYNNGSFRNCIKKSNINLQAPSFIKFLHPGKSSVEISMYQNYYNFIIKLLFHETWSKKAAVCYSITNTSSMDNFARDHFIKLLNLIDLDLYFEVFYAIVKYRSDKITNLEYIKFYLKKFFKKFSHTDETIATFFKLFNYLEERLHIFDFWLSLEQKDRNQALIMKDNTNRNYLISHDDDVHNSLLIEQRMDNFYNEYNNLLTDSIIKTNKFNIVVDKYIDFLSDQKTFSLKCAIRILEIIHARKHNDAKVKYYVHRYLSVKKITRSAKKMTKKELTSICDFIVEQEASNLLLKKLSTHYLGTYSTLIEAFVFICSIYAGILLFINIRDFSDDTTYQQLIIYLVCSVMILWLVLRYYFVR